MQFLRQSNHNSQTCVNIEKIMMKKIISHLKSVPLQQNQNQNIMETKENCTCACEPCKNGHCDQCSCEDCKCEGCTCS